MKHWLLVVCASSWFFAALAAHAFVECDPNLQNCQGDGIESYLQSIRWVDERGAVCDNGTLELRYADNPAPHFDEPLVVKGDVEGQ